MKYPKEHFEIQVRFVEQLSKIMDKDFIDLFPYYSEAKYRLKISKDDFHPNNHVWLRFIEEHYLKKDKVSAYYDFACMREEEIPKEKAIHDFGYFRYEYELYKKTIRIHTVSHKAEANEAHPLSSEMLTTTHNNLKMMFTEALKKFPEAKYVRGNSWLYNINSYKRLFPASYYAQPEVKHTTYGGLALWGQFLDKHLQVKTEIRDTFYEKLNKATSFQEAVNAFPYQVLEVKGEIKDFYSFYDIK